MGHFLGGGNGKKPRLVDHRYKPQTDDALPASIANLESIDRLDVGGGVARPRSFSTRRAQICTRS